jgi:hypothetical protein
VQRWLWLRGFHTSTLHAALIAKVCWIALFEQFGLFYPPGGQ